MLSHPLHREKWLLVTINIHLKVHTISMTSRIHVAQTIAVVGVNCIFFLDKG
jgi:hypothetical protein